MSADALGRNDARGMKDGLVSLALRAGRCVEIVMVKAALLLAGLFVLKGLPLLLVAAES